MELAGLGKPSIYLGQTRESPCQHLSEAYLLYPESRQYLKSGLQFN